MASATRGSGSVSSARPPDTRRTPGRPGGGRDRSRPAGAAARGGRAPRSGSPRDGRPPDRRRGRRRSRSRSTGGSRGRAARRSREPNRAPSIRAFTRYGRSAAPRRPVPGRPGRRSAEFSPLYAARASAWKPALTASRAYSERSGVRTLSASTGRAGANAATRSAPRRLGGNPERAGDVVGPPRRDERELGQRGQRGVRRGMQRAVPADQRYPAPGRRARAQPLPQRPLGLRDRRARGGAQLVQHGYKLVTRPLRILDAAARARSRVRAARAELLRSASPSDVAARSRPDAHPGRAPLGASCR